MELRNVVLIGLGPSGAGAARELAQSLPSTHRVVAISERPYAFFPLAALRAAVVPGWERKVVRSLDDFFSADKDARHRVLGGTAVTALGDHSLTLSKPFDETGSTELEFDYCVIATGSSYTFPGRPGSNDETLADVHHSFIGMQQDVAKASTVLIIGGGPVGVEFAGEVKAQHPGKRVVLVGADKTLVPGHAAMSADLRKQLRHLGVEVITGQTVDVSKLETGLIPHERRPTLSIGDIEVSPDYVFMARGNKMRNSLVQALDPEAVDERGLAKVDKYLRVKGHESIFAVGDIAGTQEPRVWYHGQDHGPVAASNISKLLSSSSPSLDAYQRTPESMLVTVGPDGGSGHLFETLPAPSWLVKATKSSELLIPKFEALYDPKAAPSTEAFKSATFESFDAGLSSAAAALYRLNQLPSQRARSQNPLASSTAKNEPRQAVCSTLDRILQRGALSGRSAFGRPSERASSKPASEQFTDSLARVAFVGASMLGSAKAPRALMRVLTQAKASLPSQPARRL